MSIRRPFPKTYPWFKAGFDCESSGHITVTSQKTEPVLFYLFVLEFGGPDNKYMFSVPVYNSDLNRNGETPIQFSPTEWIYGHNSYVPFVRRSGRSVTLNFASPMMLVSCPEVVAVSFAAVLYKNGNKSVVEPPHLRISPIVFSAPIPNPEKLVTVTSQELEGRLDIDADGHATLSDVAGDQTSDQALIGLVGTVIRKWRFIPFIQNGKREAGGVRFVFLVGDRPLSRQRIEALGRKYPGELLWSIRAIPPSTQPPGLSNRWQVFVGGDPVARGRE